MEADQPPVPPVIQPTSIKVFGILHLVIAGLGTLQTVFGIITLFFKDQLAKFQGVGMPEEEAKALQESYIALQEKTLPFTVMTYAFSIILAVLLLLAGLALLKNKKSALKKNRVYAISSIVFKVITIIMTAIFVMPAMSDYMEKSMGTGAMAAGTQEMMSNMTSIITIVVMLLAMIYPIVSLIILNKQPVKDYLATEGVD